VDYGINFKTLIEKGYMKQENCIFCKIAAGDAPAKVLWENEEFMAIENKYPDAPIHILVIPKEHWEKSDEQVQGKEEQWGRIMDGVFAVIYKQGLQNKGFKISINGGGNQGVNHEHIHILSGIEKEAK